MKSPPRDRGVFACTRSPQGGEDSDTVCAIRALAAEQDSEPARDKSLWSAAKRYYSDATQGTEGAPTWSALTSEQRDNLPLLRGAELVTRAADALERRAVHGEPSDADGGVGWFEWFKMPENTTEIAYVYENGDVFDPARGWNPPEFTIAAAEGRVFRLVRAAAATQEGENRG